MIITVTMPSPKIADNNIINFLQLLRWRGQVSQRSLPDLLSQWRTLMNIMGGAAWMEGIILTPNPVIDSVIMNSIALGQGH